MIGGVFLMLPSIAACVVLLKNAASLVELALRERIELVIVANRAAGRQAEPDFATRFRAIAGVEHEIFFGDRTTFVGGDVAAIEARGDLLIERAFGQQIAGELLDRELIERHGCR